MASGEKETIWEADPHTIAKIAILQAYLVAYFQILGRSRRGQELLYIDGFAGPDEYTNHSNGGSPSAALEAARLAVTNTGAEWKAGKIHCAFVESRKDRYDHLVSKLSGFQANNIVVHHYHAEFINALPQIRKDVPGPFVSEYPLFVFVDPFGATGIPFESVAAILDSSCSEVLINLDADGIARIFSAQDAASHTILLNSVFGDSDWQEELTSSLSFGQQCRLVLQMYKTRLRRLKGVRFIFDVEMQGASSTLNYFLVFASKHPLGLEKMKEAMKRLSQNGSYRFSDGHVDQSALFRFDEPESYHMQLYEKFKGQLVDYDSENDVITEYALNSTPFTNAKSMLTLLERDDLITAVARVSGRKKGVFNNSVRAIDFHGKVADGVLF